MSRRHLRIRDILKPGESHHFARLALGPVDPAETHDHDFPELFWVEQGRGIHLLRGKPVEIESGTLIFIRPEERHNVGSREMNNAQCGPVLICNLAFPARTWAAFRRRHRAAIGADWFPPGPPSRRCRRVGPGVLAFLRRAGLELASTPRSPLMLERFFLNLAFALRAPEETPEHLPGWLRESAERIEREKLFRQEGGTLLARVARRSAAHVAREVRRLLGKTPTDWINEIRMRHAAQLLAGTRREILDICADCGFENVGHFYALFRIHHGMTPLGYRRRSSLVVRPGTTVPPVQPPRPATTTPTRKHT